MLVHHPSGNRAGITLGQPSGSVCSRQCSQISGGRRPACSDSGLGDEQDPGEQGKKNEHQAKGQYRSGSKFRLRLCPSWPGRVGKCLAGGKAARERML